LRSRTVCGSDTVPFTCWLVAEGFAFEFWLLADGVALGRIAENFAPRTFE